MLASVLKVLHIRLGEMGIRCHHLNRFERLALQVHGEDRHPRAGIRAVRLLAAQIEDVEAPVALIP